MGCAQTGRTWQGRHWGGCRRLVAALFVRLPLAELRQTNN
jgi:hypothetical protein